MIAQMLRWFISAACLLGLFVSVNPKLNAAVYNASLDVNLFGYLNQNDIPTIGGFSSAPTASVNAYVYLQNRFPGIYGTSLAGTTYSNWNRTAQSLAGRNYMDTANNGTTFIRDQIYGNVSYTNATVPNVNVFGGQTILADGFDWTPDRPQPPFIQQVYPTWQSLYFAMLQQKAILIDIYFPGLNPGTHTVTGTSFYWNDIDDDGLIELPEGAVIDFIDPLDPGDGPDPQGNVRPKRSFGRVYEELLPPGTVGGDRRLKFIYETPGTGFRSTSEGYIASVFYIHPVPEPSSIAVFSIGVSGWYLRSLGRKKKSKDL